MGDVLEAAAAAAAWAAGVAAWVAVVIAALLRCFPARGEGGLVSVAAAEGVAAPGAVMAAATAVLGALVQPPAAFA
mgnify:CR=1 FL=1